MNAADLQKITDWIVGGAKIASNPAEAMAEICERLVDAGLPLWRVGFFVRTLHPDVFGRNFVWKPGADLVVGSTDFDVQDSPQFNSSPLAIVFRQGREVRCRLDDPESKHFPFLDEDMRAEEVTDYIALPLRFTDGSVNASSWTTKQPGGFTDEHLIALRALMPPLTRMIEIANLTRKAAVLLDTYVGNRAGFTD